MRSLFGICLSGAVLTLALGCGKKDSTTASGGGSASLEGTYLIVGVEMNGKNLPDELVTKGPEDERTIKITADKMIVMKMGKEDPATYTLDKSKNPPHINLVGKKDDGKDEKMHGIYKLDGDTLTLCMVESDKAEDRPTEFKTTKDNKAMIMTMTKKK